MINYRKFQLLKNLKKSKTKKKYNFKKNNLKNIDEIDKILKLFKPNYIINFAAESHVDRSIDDPLYFINNNINIASNLFFSYVKYSKSNKAKLFHISTDEVYGSVINKRSKEFDGYNPASPYSASKASVDMIALSFNKTFNSEIKIINLSNNYGPYQFPEKFIPNIILHLFKNKPVPIYGKGKNIREWMYVEDCCSAILKTILSNKKFQKLNIGSENRVSNFKIAQIIYKIMSSKNLTKITKKKFINYVKDRPGHDLRYALDTSKFKKMIKYKIKKKLYDGLLETIEWYLQNKKWLKNINKKYNYKRLGLFD